MMPFAESEFHEWFLDGICWQLFIFLNIITKHNLKGEILGLLTTVSCSSTLIFFFSWKFVQDKIGENQ